MIRVFRQILSNGFKVVTVEMPYLHSVRISLFVRVGSRFETPQTNGLSHLLEHMLFRGTQPFPSIYALNNAIEEIGSDLTGMTRREDCSFWFDLNPKFLQEGLNIFSDIFLNSLLRTADLRVEKKIVLKEYLEDVDERGVDTDVDNVISHVLWGGSPLGFKILGEPKILERFNRAHLLKHFRTFYVPNNMLLCVSGKVSHQDVEKVILKKFKNLTYRYVPDPVPAPKNQTHPRATFIEHDWNQTEIKLAFRAFSFKDSLIFPLTLLDDIVGAGISSRLNLSICEQLGLAYFVSSSMDCFSDDGSFDLDVTVKAGDSVRGVHAILKEVEKLCHSGVSQQELNKAKERYLSDLEKDKDSPARMCVRYGLWELKQNSLTLEKEKSLIEQVSLTHIKNLIHHLFQAKNLNVAVLGAMTRKEEKEIKKLLRRTFP